MRPKKKLSLLRGQPIGKDPAFSDLGSTTGKVVSLAWLLPAVFFQLHIPKYALNKQFVFPIYFLFSSLTTFAVVRKQTPSNYLKLKSLNARSWSSLATILLMLDIVT